MSNNNHNLENDVPKQAINGLRVYSIYKPLQDCCDATWAYTFQYRRAKETSDSNWQAFSFHRCSISHQNVALSMSEAEETG
ncbi:hypothetical protein QC761_0101530 [Podospora bellae-mahoneyi]|uniref:Uncharacterized protein n=1 Tax=Podospora bellae-mahoneyi TaxID=2093777 RepID=A0ABR0F800_9PEZI|nr:hypothetical protein QC761_0101530 [Podospora bellae-mahoneyi]